MVSALLNAARTAMIQAFVDRLDGGALSFRTAADAEAASWPINTPAESSVTNGVATLDDTGMEDLTAAGQAAAVTKIAVLNSSAGVECVLAINTDFTITDDTIDAGDEVTPSAAPTFTMPAS